MKKFQRTLRLLALTAVAVAAPATAHLPVTVDGQQLPSLAPMLENVTPAVVNIATKSRVRIRENPLFQDPFFRRFFDIPEQHRQQRPAQSLGSGVIVDAARGYVLTNNHVIDKADEITVTL
ncbi:MAG TPA: serine endoprotease DegQ, partial [Gammaproteobacteria bacterium]|nr:serine endoprotease DegQ [Gammaproteobacteria bacterium]